MMMQIQKTGLALEGGPAVKAIRIRENWRISSSEDYDDGGGGGTAASGQREDVKRKRKTTKYCK